MSDLESMFGLTEAAAGRTREVNRLQGIINEITKALADVLGDDVYRARTEELPHFIQVLSGDPRAHICMEYDLQQRLKHLQRTLDAKDHELAALKGEP